MSREVFATITLFLGVMLGYFLATPRADLMISGALDRLFNFADRVTRRGRYRKDGF